MVTMDEGISQGIWSLRVEAVAIEAVYVLGGECNAAKIKGLEFWNPGVFIGALSRVLCLYLRYQQIGRNGGKNSDEITLCEPEHFERKL
jgi:hypothetical protein